MTAAVLDCRFKGLKSVTRTQSNGVFVCRNSGERDVKGSYYMSLANGDPGQKLQVTKKYGKKYMVVVAELVAGAKRERY